jgi:hypothetical protein
MTIVPDDKDWTWILERPCDLCGFDPATAAPDEIPHIIRRNADEWGRVLARTDVRLRPDPSTWSPLEYACHVRDVFRLYDHRLHRMLAEDDPTYDNWDQDATAVADRYDIQDPTVVAQELREAAEQLAAGFGSVDGDGWQRPGTRSDGARFTVASFAVYLVHDPIHHVWDVER